MRIPDMGYGIRYENGMFRQGYDDGRQVEAPEDLLHQRHAWEFERPEASYRIGFSGFVSANGVWQPESTVDAVAYDMPVVGWEGVWANTLRLWLAQPTRPDDLERFNRV